MRQKLLRECVAPVGHKICKTRVTLTRFPVPLIPNTQLRAKVLAKRHKARLGDALIAQSCIDHGIPLLTRDRDFRAFADAAGLDLVIGSGGP